MGVHASTTSAFSLGSGYTNLTTNNVSARAVAMESKVVAATGAQTATFSIAAARVNIGGVVTFSDVPRNAAPSVPTLNTPAADVTTTLISVTGDSGAIANTTDSTFATIRAANGTSNFVQASNIGAFLWASTTTNQYSNFTRSMWRFDLSGLPAGEQIVSATLSLFGRTATDNALGGGKIGITQGASGTTIVNSDYQNSVGFTTRFASDIDVSSWSTSGYNDFALNAAGLTYLTGVGTGIATLASKTNYDIDNTTTGITWSSGSALSFRCYGPEQGAGFQPKLTVYTRPTVTTTTPDLTFTGTDTDSDTIEYEIQVDTVNTFDSQTSTPAFVQTTKGNGNLVTSYSLTAFGSNTIAGNLIVVSIEVSSLTVSSVTDNAGNTYQLATSISTSGMDSEIWYAYNIAGGVSPTITVHHPSAGTSAAVAQEFSGIESGSDPLDQTATNSGTGGTANSGTTSSTTRANELIIGAIADNFNAPTVGTGYSNLATKVDGGGNSFSGIESKVVSSTGTQSATFNSTSSFWSVCIATFKGSFPPLIDKQSITPDATFTDVTNGADTHPFASGDQIKYTVQAGDALINGNTYYWRVRGRDPSGSNTYGSWSTVESFIVSAGVSDLTINKSDSSAVTESIGRMVESYINKSDSSTVTENTKPEINSFINVSDTSGVTDNIKVEANNNLSVSDTSAVTDVPAVLVPFYNVSVSDSSVVTDSVRLEINSFINKSDTSGVTDSVSASVASTLSVSDTTSLTESVKAEVNSFVNKSDSSAVTDSTSQYVSVFFVSVSDTSTISESLLLVDVDGIAVLDSSTVTENVVIQITALPDLSVSVSDSSAITESIARLATSFISPSDSTTVTESIKLEINSYISKSDSTSLSENTKVESNNFINVSDSSTVTDSIAVFIPFYTINTSDSSTVSDSPNVSIAVPNPTINVSEATTLTEGVLLIDIENIGIIDSTGMTENVSILIPFSMIFTSDSSTVTDSNRIEINSYINKTDTTIVTDSMNEFLTSFISVNDGTTIADSIKVEASNFVNVNNGSTVTELVSLLLPSLFINASDTTTVTENTSVSEVSQGPSLSVSDSSTVSENTNIFIPTLTVSVSDASAVSDSVSLVELVSVNVSNTTSITESIQRLVTSSINKSDSITVTDSSIVSRTGLIVSDTVTITESVSIARISFVHDVIDVPLQIPSAINLPLQIAGPVRVSLTIAESIELPLQVPATITLPIEVPGSLSAGVVIPEAVTLPLQIPEVITLPITVN